MNIMSYGLCHFTISVIYAIHVIYDLYDIYHITVMYMTKQVSKEAYGPQVCSQLSQITNRNLVRGKNWKIPLTYIFLYIFIISFVYFRFIVLRTLKIYENMVLVKVSLFFMVKCETMHQPGKFWNHYFMTTPKNPFQHS